MLVLQIRTANIYTAGLCLRLFFPSFVHSVSVGFLICCIHRLKWKSTFSSSSTDFILSSLCVVLFSFSKLGARRWAMTQVCDASSSVWSLSTGKQWETEFVDILACGYNFPWTWVDKSQCLSVDLLQRCLHMTSLIWVQGITCIHNTWGMFTLLISYFCYFFVESSVSVSSQLSCTASSRAVSPLVVIPGDFSQPASPFGCLDNSAAKHKMGLRHKACNKRKPVNVRHVQNRHTHTHLQPTFMPEYIQKAFSSIYIPPKLLLQMILLVFDTSCHCCISNNRLISPQKSQHFHSNVKLL